MSFFAFVDSNAGKSAVGIVGAAFLLAWPPALPWIAAVFLLQFGIRHLTMAFQEVDGDHVSAWTDHRDVANAIPSLAAPDDGGLADDARNGAVPARSPLD